jgi:hypothetical protein
MRLTHGERLPHPRLVEAHEVGVLAGKVDQQHLAAAQCAAGVIGEGEELFLHHCSAPKTSMPLKRQAGLA